MNEIERALATPQDLLDNSIDTAPEIDAVPVVRGEWKMDAESDRERTAVFHKQVLRGMR